MASIERAMRRRSEQEPRLLRISAWATLWVAGLGILFGLLARSPAIPYDGCFARIEVAVSSLTILFIADPA